MIQFRIKYPYEYKLAKRSEITYYCDTHLEGTLHQEPREKSEDLFFGETPIPGKMPTFLENFRSFS